LIGSARACFNSRQKDFLCADETAEKKPPGAHPETLAIEGNWKDAMKKALQKKRPAEGWPKPKRKKAKD